MYTYTNKNDAGFDGKHKAYMQATSCKQVMTDTADE